MQGSGEADEATGLPEGFEASLTVTDPDGWECTLIRRRSTARGRWETATTVSNGCGRAWCRARQDVPFTVEGAAEFLAARRAEAER